MKAKLEKLFHEHLWAEDVFEVSNKKTMKFLSGNKPHLKQNVTLLKPS